MDSMNHPEMLVFEDANKPRWWNRTEVTRQLSTDRTNGLKIYQDSVASLIEGGWLDEPLPDLNRDAAFDGFTIKTDKVFGQGSVPSKECYTPQPESESIRKLYEGGDLSAAEFLLLRRLYEYPLSVIPYRGAIPIAYVAQRKGWDFVRPIQSFLSMRTMLGGKKVVIIDDAHKMTPEAQNCLLKTLEEPPPDSLLILITWDRGTLFETIVSRCQCVGFGRLTGDEVSRAADLLLGSAPGKLVVAMSEGCPGRLLALGLTGIEQRLEEVRALFQGLADGHLESVFAFVGAVMGSRSSHRKKMREDMGRALELALLWMLEILHTKRGLPDRIGLSTYRKALSAQAQTFEEGALMDASRHIERSFRTLHLNVDLNLFLTTTLLGLARTLRSKTG
jgi:DNA polymerase-3 subunit delta'